MSLIKREIDIDILAGDVSMITEVGGGYGNFCRLVHQFGYSGSYNIIDMPEMCGIQKCFLTKALPYNVVSKIDFLSVNDIEKNHEMNYPSLLIATFSVSEMPIETRKKVRVFHE